jgi:hypothetical protein
MFYAHFVERAEYAAIEQAPEILSRVHVDRGGIARANVVKLYLIDRFVMVLFADGFVSTPSILEILYAAAYPAAQTFWLRHLFEVSLALRSCSEIRFDIL